VVVEIGVKLVAAAASVKAKRTEMKEGMEWNRIE
jgi:hypothetical protein